MPAHVTIPDTPGSALVKRALSARRGEVERGRACVVPAAAQPGDAATLAPVNAILSSLFVPILLGCACGSRDAAPAPVPEPVPATPPAPTAEPGPESEPTEVTAATRARSRDMTLDGVPSPRADHTAVWTGREVIVWGGDDALPSEDTGYAPVPPHPLGDGAAYDVANDRWRAVARRGAPPARTGHSAIFTGTEMIVWGGAWGTTAIATGGRYDPARDRWRAVSTRGAPSARGDHCAVWTGSEMIVIGGTDGTRSFADGARYDPATDRWTPIAADPALPPRADAACGWTGDALVVWGGGDGERALGDGALFYPANGWRPIATESAPSPRLGFAWAFREASADAPAALAIVGGHTGETSHRDGAVYDPARDRWRALPHMPVALVSPAAAWTRDTLIVAGEPEDTEMYPPPDLLALPDGARTWAPFAAAPGLDRPAVLAGDHLVLWGGFVGTNLMPEGAVVSLPLAAE